MPVVTNKLTFGRPQTRQINGMHKTFANPAVLGDRGKGGPPKAKNTKICCERFGPYSVILMQVSYVDLCLRDLGVTK